MCHDIKKKLINAEKNNKSSNFRFVSDTGVIHNDIINVHETTTI